MAAPRVSVVIPAYNAEDYLSEALDSVITQTYRDIEIVVVDDGSSDRTSGILERYSRLDDRMIVHRQPNGGVVAALNRGVALARGEFIARMDADDIALPHRLERQVGFLDDHPAVAVVGGAVILVNDKNEEFHRVAPPASDALIKAMLQDNSTMVHPAVLIRRDVMRALGGYRAVVEYAEDYDLWLRIAERHELANLQEPVLRYRIHAHQASARTRHQANLAWVAANLAAAERDQNRPDPLEGLDKIDEDVLRALGADDDTIIHVEINWCRWWAKTFGGAGYRRASAEAWKDARRLARCASDADELRRRLHRNEVAALRQRGAWFRAAWIAASWRLSN
jgi:glycosyltransferase involved in cell wall biosynthesis